METSIDLMADQLTVKFVDVLESYPANEDIECKYTYNNWELQDGDRVAMFKLGWKSLRNYILFEWAFEASPFGEKSVIFSRWDLPNTPHETDDLFQFCYISGDNVVQGISTPFQIHSAETKTNNLTDSLKNENQCLHLKSLLSLKDKEILRLKEENAILRESMKALVDQRKFQKRSSYDDEIAMLKETTKTLTNALLSQQKELEAIRIEMRKDKADYKNLQLEKILAEKKYEAISSKKETRGIKRLNNVDLDLENLQSLPPFPFDGPDAF